MALGLWTRSRHAWVPGWAARHAGDALWASCAYCTFAFLVPTAGRSRLALAAFGLASVVEVSQLWQAPWLDRFRSTTAGALLLGRGFDWWDFPRYAAGVVFALLLDSVLLGARSGRSTTSGTRGHHQRGFQKM